MAVKEQHPAGQLPASQLPAGLCKEIEGLRNFEIQTDQVTDQVTLAARVRGVPIWIRLDPAAYPGGPPELFLAEGWSWGEISAFEGERRIAGLSTQARWNRTYGLGILLRDLEIVFSQTPPRHHQPSAARLKLRRLREGGRGAIDSFIARLGKIRDWMRRKLTRATPVTRIRSEYQHLIEEKVSRIERYREALAKLEGPLKTEAHPRKARQRKLAEHKRHLEVQVRELEDLKKEAREVEAELTLTQIEQEILDVRSGVDRSDLAGQREEMLRSVRDKRAKLRVSKRLAGVSQEDEDAQYLERGLESGLESAKTSGRETSRRENGRRRSDSRFALAPPVPRPSQEGKEG